jgi:hypothetical protein
MFGFNLHIENYVFRCSVAESLCAAGGREERGGAAIPVSQITHADGQWNRSILPRCCLLFYWMWGRDKIRVLPSVIPVRLRSMLLTITKSI